MISTLSLYSKCNFFNTQKKILSSVLLVSLVVSIIFIGLTCGQISTALPQNLCWLYGAIALSCCLDLIFFCRSKKTPAPSQPHVEPTKQKKLAPPVSLFPSLTTEDPLIEFITRFGSDYPAQRLYLLAPSFPPGYQFDDSFINIAIKNRDIKAIKWLIDRNLHLNSPNRFHVACSLGYSDILELLCHTESTKTSDGNIVSLITMLQTIHILDYSRLTPLDYAARAGSLDCLRVLEKYGAFTIYQGPDKNAQALRLAIQHKKFDCIKFLISKDLLKNTNMEEVSFHFIIDNFEVVKVILDRDEFYNESEPFMRLVRNAIHSQKEEILEYLFQIKKISIDLQVFHGETLIFQAFSHNKISMVKYFLRKKPDLKILNNKRQNLFHAIASIDHARCSTPALINILLKEIGKEGINDEDREGNTPIHLAILSKNVELVQEFMKHNVDLTKKNKKGLTPLDLAQEVFKEELAPIIFRIRPERERYVEFIADLRTQTERQSQAL